MVQSSGSLGSSSDLLFEKQICIHLSKAAQGILTFLWEHVCCLAYPVALFMDSDRVLLFSKPIRVRLVSEENCSEGKIKGVYSPTSSLGRLYSKDLHDCIVMYVTAWVVIGSFDIQGLDQTSVDTFVEILSLNVGILWFKINDVTSAR